MTKKGKRKEFKQIRKKNKAQYALANAVTH